MSRISVSSENIGLKRNDKHSDCKLIQIMMSTHGFLIKLRQFQHYPKLFHDSSLHE
jgi:hypothetical protein